MPDIEFVGIRSMIIPVDKKGQDMVKVTVVIPNYNGVKYIGNCLESLYRLKEQELFEVLVVDNGSEDGGLEVVKKYSGVKLVELSENTGFCHAVNVGIEEAQTPYVILLNNDTVVLEGFVKGLVDAIEQDEKMFAASAMMLQWQDHDRIDDAGDQYCVLGWAYARGKGKSASDYQKPAKIFAACGGASIYRKEILDQIGYFDENHFAYLEDIDICYRAAIHGYHCYYTPAAKVLHAGSATSGSRYNEFKTSHASANSIYLIGKNMPLLQLVWNLPFLLLGFFIKTLFFYKKGMGPLYLEGLINGLHKLKTPEGRTHKVPFQWRNLAHYLAIQAKLYKNTITLITKH